MRKSEADYGVSMASGLKNRYAFSIFMGATGFVRKLRDAADWTGWKPVLRQSSACFHWLILPFTMHYAVFLFSRRYFGRRRYCHGMNTTRSPELRISNPDRLIAEARSGAASLGDLLDLYKTYLTLLARMAIGRRLQGKLDPSDLVQETFLEAHRSFKHFQGNDEPRFVAWLRQILANRVANLVRHYFGTQARNIRMEQELAVELNNSSHTFANDLAASLTSPSQQAAKREQAVLLAQALQQLPENHREVIILRHLEGLTFPQVAERMQRTLDSVEKLWLRALGRLRQVFGDKE